MIWHLSHRFDRAALALVDGTGPFEGLGPHYSRQQIGTPQFVPPGSPVVLVSLCGRAVWVTLHQKHVDHAWAGAWLNTMFRNEGAGLSSELIRDAVAATLFEWGMPPPPVGLITFIDPEKVRHKRDPGRCYRKAGFRRAWCPEHWLLADPDCAACRSRTERNDLHVFQLPPDDMPEPRPAIGAQSSLFPEAARCLR